MESKFTFFFSLFIFLHSFAPSFSSLASLHFEGSLFFCVFFFFIFLDRVRNGSDFIRTMAQVLSEKVSTRKFSPNEEQTIRMRNNGQKTKFIQFKIQKQIRTINLWSLRFAVRKKIKCFFPPLRNVFVWYYSFALVFVFFGLLLLLSHSFSGAFC